MPTTIVSLMFVCFVFYFVLLLFTISYIVFAFKSNDRQDTQVASHVPFHILKMSITLEEEGSGLRNGSQH